jgi:hypothetical protein
MVMSMRGRAVGARSSRECALLNNSCLLQTRQNPETVLRELIRIDDLREASSYATGLSLLMQHCSAITSHPSMKLTPPKGASRTTESQPVMAFK